jgi:site-specific recombinase XerD
LSDAPEAQIHVKRKAMKGKGKGRSVWAHSECRIALRLYLAARESQTGRAAADNEYVFASGRRHGARPLAHYVAPPFSKPLCRKTVWKLLKKTIRRAGIYDRTATGTHTMRKTFAQEIFAASGNNLLVAQKALGHVNIQSTVKYLSSVDGDVKSLVLNRKIA